LEKLVSAIKGTPPPERTSTVRQPTPPPNMAQPALNIIGTWGVQYQHPMTMLGGYGQIVCFPNGQFQSGLMTPQGEIGAQGTWQMAGNQVALQGVYAFVLQPFNQLPYSLVMTVNTYNQSTINFVAMSGELVVWQRMA
jgi:hypothetical protein